MNRENLKILADYLESLPEDYESFNMSTYYSGSLPTLDYMGGNQGCGTVACAAGHGPAAGLILTPEQLAQLSLRYPYNRWSKYCKIIFGLSVDEGDTQADWVFSGVWAEIDNSVYGAAARIYYLLEHGGPPKNFDANPYEDWTPFIEDYQPFWKGTRNVEVIT